MTGFSPYHELAAAVAARTGFPHVLPLGGGLGPIRRLLLSPFPGPARRVATDLALPGLMRACGVEALPAPAPAPALLCVGPTPFAPAAPDAALPETAGRPAMLVLPDLGAPGRLAAALGLPPDGLFAAIRRRFDGLALSLPLGGGPLAGFLAVADPALAAACAEFGPPGGEWPDIGVGLENACETLLAGLDAPPGPPPAPMADPAAAARLEWWF